MLSRTWRRCGQSDWRMRLIRWSAKTGQRATQPLSYNQRPRALPDSRSATRKPMNWLDRAGRRTKTMKPTEVYEKLTAIFRDVFDEDDLSLTPETTADDVDGWDSLTHIRLVLAVSKAFGVKFSASEIGNLKNVGEFATLIEKKA